MFFSEIIVLMIEGSMEFLISGYLNTDNPTLETKHSGEKMAYYVGIFCLLLICFVLPAMIIYMLTRPLTQIQKSEIFK